MFGTLVADAVAASGSLTHLEIRRKYIGDGGAAAIAAAVAASGSLTYLDLRGNKIGDAAQKLLRDAVQVRQSFELNV